MNRIFTMSLPCLLLLLSSCIFSENPTNWTVMSWNVQNLFDDVDNGTEYTEFDPGTGNWDTRLFERRLDRTAEVITKTVSGGADLVVLQELENQNVLNRLLEGPLKKQGYNYHLAIPGYSIIRCGVLSRYPISQVYVADCGEWEDRPLRPLLSFTVTTPGGNVTVVALHWKSPRGDREATEGARIREAQFVRNLIVEKLQNEPNSKILVIGDLNTPGDGLVLPAALAPFSLYEQASSEVVLWRSNNPHTQFPESEILLFDPEPASGPPGTYNYLGKWDRPDRALLTPNFLEQNGLLFSSARISNLDILFDSYGNPSRWRSDWEEGYSDHLPLVLEFGW